MWLNARHLKHLVWSSVGLTTRAKTKPTRSLLIMQRHFTACVGSTTTAVRAPLDAFADLPWISPWLDTASRISSLYSYHRDHAPQWTTNSLPFSQWLRVWGNAPAQPSPPTPNQYYRWFRSINHRPSFVSSWQLSCQRLQGPLSIWPFWEAPGNSPHPCLL